MNQANQANTESNQAGIELIQEGVQEAMKQNQDSIESNKTNNEFKKFNFETLSEDSIPEREGWFKMVLSKTIRYVYWPSNNRFCTRYVEISEDLSLNVMAH